MGGGADSRIPSILSECLPSSVRMVVRTYDFDPEKAHLQILSWVEELSPCLVVGESLGAVHALRLRGIPHIFVCPAFGAPWRLGLLSYLCVVPGVSSFFSWLYKPRPGERQVLHFDRVTLGKYPAHWKDALGNTPSHGSRDYFFAFFGTKDHYRRRGVVSVRQYRRLFGESYAIFNGTHFMEEEWVRGMLADKILEVLEGIGS